MSKQILQKRSYDKNYAHDLKHPVEVLMLQRRANHPEKNSLDRFQVCVNLK